MNNFIVKPNLSVKELIELEGKIRQKEFETYAEERIRELDESIITHLKHDPRQTGVFYG